VSAQKAATQPTLVWGVQLAGTVGIAVAIYLFFDNAGPIFKALDGDWMRFGLTGILSAALPSIYYLRTYKRALNADIAASTQANGVPDPKLRMDLMKKLSVGSALSEMPLALGVVYLLAGGETRWFVGAACLSFALRLSYRPFTGSR
jgi:hypothetical protein